MSSVRRIMGIETEYGISLQGEPYANPVLLSGRIVNAYATRPGTTVSRTRWDYETERPLSDARGYDIAREIADPSQLTDEVEDEIAANVVLTNGARLYVDHAHPEYSSPEVTSPRDTVTWDRAGELVMAEAVAQQALSSGEQINLYKNNTDGKGASYGTHENYLLRRDVPWKQVVQGLTPFFVGRQVFTGAGRVGIGQLTERSGFQLTQRADFFEREVGLETTLRRPIINTRDEPHADWDKYRRLHVIIGDANQCDVANLLKMGTTSLVLGMIEADALPRTLELANPVAALGTISHDPSLKSTVELADGRRMTGLDLCWAYYEQADDWLSRERGDDLDEDTQEVMTRWSGVLSALGSDPMALAGQLDWVAKLALLDGYRARDGLDWSDARLRALDIQWSDVRPDKGIHHKLEAGARIERVVDPADVVAAMTTPPTDTRAYLRGELVRRWPEQVRYASWDSIVVKASADTRPRRVALPEPLAANRAEVGALVDGAVDVTAVLDVLDGGTGEA